MQRKGQPAGESLDRLKDVKWLSVHDLKGTARSGFLASGAETPILPFFVTAG
jgi:hypothetical protein